MRSRDREPRDGQPRDREPRYREFRDREYRDREIQRCVCKPTLGGINVTSNSLMKDLTDGVVWTQG